MANTAENILRESITEEDSDTTFSLTEPQSRKNYLAYPAAAAVMVGILLPIPVWLLDILWVLSICLAAAVIIIAFSAKNSAELYSLPKVLGIDAFFRIALAGATSRTMLFNNSAGPIIDGIGGALAGSIPLLTAILAIAAAAVFSGLIFSAAKKTHNSCRTFLFETMPVKKIGIETDLNIGLITKNQADNLNNKLASETKFYRNLSTCASLLCIETAISLFAVIIIPAVLRMTWFAALPENGAMEYGGLIIGAASLILPVLLGVATAAAYLAGKTSLTLRPADCPAGDNPQTYEIISARTQLPEEIDLLNPDFMTVNQAASESIENNSAITGSFHESAKSLADSAHSGGKTLLLTAEKTNNLPVTVAVNMAIQYASEMKKILLIDADPARNAVAQAFNISGHSRLSAPVATCIENLSIITAAEPQKIMNIILKFAHSFDRIIVYAPVLKTVLPAFQAGMAQPADVIIFADDASKGNVSACLRQAGCNTLGIVQPPGVTII